MRFVARSTLVVLAVLLAGCGGGGNGPVTASAIEDAVRPELEKRLSEVPGPETSLDSLDCVRKSDSEGTCIAEYSDANGGKATSRIIVDIDPDTGDFAWQQEPVSQ